MTEAECAERIADGAKRIREWRVANAQQRTAAAANAATAEFWAKVDAARASSPSVPRLLPWPERNVGRG